MMPMLLGVLVLSLAAGVSSLLLSRRMFAAGRPAAGDEPRCARCGYELTGLPTDRKRCPECGAAFWQAGVAQGLLRHSFGLLAIGAGLLFVALLALLAAMVLLAGLLIRDGVG